MSDVVERAKAALEGATPGPWEATWEDADKWWSVTAGPIDNMVCPEVTTVDGRPADAEFIAQARTLVPELVAEVERLRAGIERVRAEHREFASHLGFGDGVTEPAASLAEMVDLIEAAFSEARDHQECPRICEQCGERLAATLCPDCHGSGGNAALCEASGAYVECEQCGGAGWIHEGCAESTYADLAAEVELLRATVERVRQLAHNPETYSGTGVVTVTPRRILVALEAD